MPCRSARQRDGAAVVGRVPCRANAKRTGRFRSPVPFALVDLRDTSMSVIEILRQLPSRDYNVGRYAISKMATTCIHFGPHLCGAQPCVATGIHALLLHIRGTARSAPESFLSICHVPTTSSNRVPVSWNQSEAHHCSTEFRAHPNVGVSAGLSLPNHPWPPPCPLPQVVYASIGRSIG
jgi:hypothetical protein